MKEEYKLDSSYSLYIHLPMPYIYIKRPPLICKLAYENDDADDNGSDNEIVGKVQRVSTLRASRMASRLFLLLCNHERNRVACLCWLYTSSPFQLIQQMQPSQPCGHPLFLFLYFVLLSFEGRSNQRYTRSSRTI